MCANQVIVWKIESSIKSSPMIYDLKRYLRNWNSYEKKGVKHDTRNKIQSVQTL